MEESQTFNISSFVIRFILADKQGSPGQSEYRGTIRHVQTDQEIAFTRWEDALKFMQRFVPVISDTSAE